MKELFNVVKTNKGGVIFKGLAILGAAAGLILTCSKLKHGGSCEDDTDANNVDDQDEEETEVEIQED